MEFHRTALASPRAIAQRWPATAQRPIGTAWHPVCIEDGYSTGVFAARTRMRLEYDLLAATARLAASRGLAAPAPGHAASNARVRPDPLGARQCGLGQRAIPHGDTLTGRNPTDRGKLGCKHHLIVDQRGLPLVVQISGANVHDSQLLRPLINALPLVAGLSGHTRRRPDKLHADKDYDYACYRCWLRQRGIAPRIARRGQESRERLGRYRWVVERTIGWLHRYRRLRIR
jgi:transposase